MAHGQGATSNRRGGYGPFDRGPRGHGKDKSAKKAERRANDPRLQAAQEETERARRELDEIIEKQQREPAVGAVAGALFAAQKKAAEEKVAAAEQEEVASQVEEFGIVSVEAQPLQKLSEADAFVAKPAKRFSIKRLKQEGEGNFEFALTTARRMMKQGYNIQYVIEFTGVGYLDLDNFPLDRDGYAIREEDEDADS